MNLTQQISTPLPQQIQLDCDGHTVPLKSTQKGDYIKKTPTAKKVWVRGEYDRSERRYLLTDFEDVNHTIYMKASHMVFVDFTF